MVQLQSFCQCKKDILNAFHCWLTLALIPIIVALMERLRSACAFSTIMESWSVLWQKCFRPKTRRKSIQRSLLQIRRTGLSREAKHGSTGMCMTREELPRWCMQLQTSTTTLSKVRRNFFCFGLSELTHFIFAFSLLRIAQHKLSGKSVLFSLKGFF
jgi:hypothetical protein